MQMPLKKQIKLEWTQDMSVGEETIDEQHKTLLDQIKKLKEDISGGRELQVLRDTLSFLNTYIEKHFSYEEKYMKEHDYPNLEKHKKIHDSFEEYFHKFDEEFRSGYLSGKSIANLSRKMGEKVQKFLGEWLMNHILKEDHKYAEHIQSQSKESMKAKKPEEKPAGDESPSFDMSKLKAEIENKLKKGHIEEHEAQILEQRAPAHNVVEGLKEKEGKKEEKKGNYVVTGIPGFDDLFENGIPKGSAILVAGGAGSGKTIMCLQTFNYHASKGKKCFYMSFEESEEKLLKHMKEFGWDSEKLVKQGNLKIRRMSPFEITRSVEGMLEKEKGELLIDINPVILPEGFKPDFIVVDSLTAIASAFTGKQESYRIYIEQLFRFFEKLGATSFLITETKQIPEIFSTTGVEEFLADGVIVLYNFKRGDIRENAIEILKMRGEKHQKKIVAMQITEKGVIVYPEQEVFGGIE